MRDRWGLSCIGIKGLEIGLRKVKNGMVKIDGTYWRSTVPGSLDKYEGKKIEVSVNDNASTSYTARDPDTLNSIVHLAIVPEL